MASSPHPLPAQEEKTLPGEGTLGGTYLLLPFPHTPALSLPDSGREIQVPSETRPNMPAQAAHKRAHTHTHTHTHTHARALSLEDGAQQEEGWTRAQVWASGGISPPAPSRGSALMAGNAHMYTSAPQAEDGAMGLGPGPGEMGSSSGDPGREVGWGLYIWLQMWLLPRLKKKEKKVPTSSRFLSVSLRLQDTCVRLCRSAGAESVYGQVKACALGTC